MTQSRRKTIKQLGLGGSALGLIGATNLISACSPSTKENGEKESKDQAVAEESSLFFQISLAQWSLHRSYFGDGLFTDGKADWQKFGQTWDTNPEDVLKGELDPTYFPTVAKEKFGIEAVEFVNVFYYSKKNDQEYWKAMRQQCDEKGVKCLLIMCDREGNLGDTDEAARNQAVENHYGWIDAAKVLGCHSIRVNAAGNGTEEEVKTAAIDGLGKLAAYGAENGINVIVENHGGYSSDGKWLSSVIEGVGSDFCGTLPDFGNFCIERSEDGCANEYDRYQGMKELMPYAKGVSAKSHEFDAEGNEVNTDYYRMMKIIKEAGFSGYIDVEYEGAELSEDEGIKATKRLLEKAGKTVS